MYLSQQMKLKNKKKAWTQDNRAELPELLEL